MADKKISLLVDENVHVLKDVDLDQNLTAKGNITSSNGNLSINGTGSIGGKLTVGSFASTGAATIGGTLGVTGATTVAALTASGAVTVNNTLSVASGKATTLGGSLSVTGATTLTGALTANGAVTVNNTLDVANGKATTLGGTLAVTGATTLNGDVNLKDADTTLKKFTDIMAELRNAIANGLSQTYDKATGKLTTELSFANTYTGNTQKTKLSNTVNLDLEKYILDINDVYATKTTSNGTTTYTDVTPTAAQLEAIEASDYSGNIRRCLKVTYGNGSNAANNSVVYFEINDIFKSTIKKIEANYSALNTAITNLTTTVTNLESTLTTRINNLESGIYGYLKDNTKEITLKDKNDTALYKFKVFASGTTNGAVNPNLNSYGITANGITLPTITIDSN